jgi:hypothetical protein
MAARRLMGEVENKIGIGVPLLFLAEEELYFVALHSSDTSTMY